MPNIEPYLSLLIQIPLVGIFVWFSLQLITVFLKAIETRDAYWRAWLEQERKSNQEAIQSMASRFANEIHALSQRIDDMNR